MCREIEDDMTATVFVQAILPCDRGGPWESHPGRCLVKDGVDSVNIYVCFLRRLCVVRRSNRCPSFHSAKCHPRSLGRSLRCCRTHHSRHTLTACAGRLSRNARDTRRGGFETPGLEGLPSTDHSARRRPMTRFFPPPASTSPWMQLRRALRPRRPRAGWAPHTGAAARR